MISDLEAAPPLCAGVWPGMLHVSDKHGADEAAEWMSGRQCLPGDWLSQDQQGRRGPGGGERDPGVQGLGSPHPEDHLEARGRREHHQEPRQGQARRQEVRGGEPDHRQGDPGPDGGLPLHRQERRAAHRQQEDQSQRQLWVASLPSCSI